MAQWTKINTFDEIPFGTFLCTVRTSEDSDPKVVVMNVVKDSQGHKLGFSGSHFYFDFYEILAYTDCPEPFKEEEE